LLQRRFVPHATHDRAHRVGIISQPGGAKG
jgi:hypothetical protein